MNGIQEIIDGLEKAAGPDRSIDHAIHALVGGAEDFPANEPRYTASIDAALTLVPDGWDWSIKGPDWHEGRRCLHFGYVRQYRKAGDPRRDAEGFARHKTPAMALCIAALKARSCDASNG